VKIAKAITNGIPETLSEDKQSKKQTTKKLKRGEKLTS
jgi:hypothetical protein